LAARRLRRIGWIDLSAPVTYQAHGVTVLHAIQQQSTLPHPLLYKKIYKAERLPHEMVDLGTQGVTCQIREILPVVINSFRSSSGNLLLLEDYLFEGTPMLPEIEDVLMV